MSMILRTLEIVREKKLVNLYFQDGAEKPCREVSFAAPKGQFFHSLFLGAGSNEEYSEEMVLGLLKSAGFVSLDDVVKAIDAVSTGTKDQKEKEKRDILDELGFSYNDESAA